jgi:hypothetical protein
MDYHAFLISHGEIVQCATADAQAEADRLLDEGAPVVSVWLVPGPIQSVYGVRNYRPDVAGALLAMVRGV